jgi:hypothetical protein
MTAATFEALVKILNALVREGWDRADVTEKAVEPPVAPAPQPPSGTSTVALASSIPIE